MSCREAGMTAVIGAGPAGLAAGLQLSRMGRPVTLLERDAVPGGIARTVQWGGYRVDPGGHRFFTRVPEISELWAGLLGDNLLLRDRLSRIYYGGRFYSYPLRIPEAVRRLGPATSARIAMSIVHARLRPRRPVDSFETWVSNQFGKVLCEKFFSSYTEKVWGRPCSEISPDWAAQRIKGLSLSRALLPSLRPRRDPNAISLSEQFWYPRLGPGMMWEACVADARANGAGVQFGAQVRRIEHSRGRATRVVWDGPAGPQELECSHVISTMPLPHLVQAIDPPAPEAIREAASSLLHRSFITVALVVPGVDLFPDTWIYIHDPTVRVGRIQNFRNWSPEMVPNDLQTTIGMEYFCNQGDDLWNSSDSDLIALASAELRQLGLVPKVRGMEGYVARVGHAYPVYDPGYQERVGLLRHFLRDFENIQTCGRSGLHRYNNIDHAMLTGLYAAENVGGANHDVWQVNAEQGYLEGN